MAEVAQVPRQRFLGFKRIVDKLKLPQEEQQFSRWVNDDIKPVEEERRNWNLWAFHNYWTIGGFNVSSYMTGSALISIGLTWWQALISLIIANFFATLFVLANCHAGAYYHIGFPVTNRSVWGMYGSFFPICNRILLSIVWYAFQSWVGGECVYVCLMAIDPNIESHIRNHMPESMGITSAQFLAYMLFFIITLPFLYIHPHRLTRFLVLSSLISAVLMVSLLIWALSTMGSSGFGSIISKPVTIPGGALGWGMAYGIISSIGSGAAGILNMNDYSRFARRPRDAIIGQLISVPVYQTLGSLIGILVTASTQNRYGAQLWNLPTLFEAIIQHGNSGSRAAAFFAGLALMVSQLGINVPGNALSGGFDLASTFPHFINIRRGAYVTAIISIAFNPWKLVTQPTTFIAVLGSYSVFTSPMIALMVSSYWIVNRRKINIDALYQGNSSSIYWYTSGVNWRAIVAWCLGVFPSLPGFVANVNTNVHVSEGWTHFYYICFLASFCITLTVYAALHYVFPAPMQQKFVKESPRILLYEHRSRTNGVEPVDSLAPRDSVEEAIVMDANKD